MKQRFYRPDRVAVKLTSARQLSLEDVINVEMILQALRTLKDPNRKFKRYLNVNQSLKLKAPTLIAALVH